MESFPVSVEVRVNRVRNIFSLDESRFRFGSHKNSHFKTLFSVNFERSEQTRAVKITNQAFALFVVRVVKEHTDR